MFDLIGGSWPPAPREPEHPDYGSVPARSTMQRSTQHERVKSVNLLNHLAPERRRNKPTTSASRASSSLEDRPTSKMVHEPKKIETGILVGK